MDAVFKELAGGGEFAEIDAPRILIMTRRFEKHPLQGIRHSMFTGDSATRGGLIFVDSIDVRPAFSHSLTP